MIKKVFIRTHGCQMNEYDSDKMLDLLEDKCSYTVTDNELEADLLLLNTCSVREKAQEKVFSQLGRWRKLKEKNPDLYIGVGGCVASQEGKAILSRAPYVDLIFGPQTLHRLPKMLDNLKTNSKSVVDVRFPEIEKFDNLVAPKANGVSAFVSIMEGCSKYCTFCVVPYTRGEEVSRPFDDVINEIKELLSQGVKEINLLGQNVNAYRAEMEDGETADLGLLITYMANVLDVKRIRYTTSHPLEMNDSLFQAHEEIDALVNHLHLPVQSGSDHILAMMKRRHTVWDYKKTIKRLRLIKPNISISSDFIVGFPGESDQDFEDTMNLIAEVNFDRSFSFIYSVRPGTPAANLADDISLDTKKLRLSRLQDRLNQQSGDIARAMVGTTETVLVESKSKQNSEQFVSGRTENNRIVNFLGSDDLVGKFVEVKIIEALRNSLRGEAV